MKVYAVVVRDANNGDLTLFLFLRKEDAIDYALNIIRRCALVHDYDDNDLKDAIDEFEKVESISLDNFIVALYEREINE